MLRIIIALIVMMLFVGAVGFTGIAGAASELAIMFFYVFASLLCISVVINLTRKLIQQE